MKSKILILTLVVALTVVSAKLFISKNTDASVNEKKTDPSETVYNNILTRTSIRSYKNTNINKAKIEKLLRAGMSAPSAMDARPWHFIVVNDKKVLQRLSESSTTNKNAASAPLAIVVCGDMDLALEGEGQECWIQDCSAATENILLEAHALGLGAVWTSTFPSEERQKNAREILSLPTEIKPLSIIIIGYPASPQKPKDKWDETAISYNEFGGNDQE